MISTKYTANSIAVRDIENNVLEIEAPDWSMSYNSLKISQDIDEIVDISARCIKLPESAVGIISSTYESWTTDITVKNSCYLPEGNHLIKIENYISTYLRTNSSVEISRNEKGELLIKFPKKTDSTLGFKARNDQPKKSISVHPSCLGVSQAINKISLDEKIGPERSFPSIRDHPPLFKINTQNDPDSEIISTRDNSSKLLELPNSIDYVFTAATFAYYTNSTIILIKDTKPRLVDKKENILYEFDEFPKFPEQICLLLKKIFDLDCLTREEGKYKSNVIEKRIANKLNYNLKSLYQSTPLERFKKYLSIDYDEIDGIFPQWHYTICIDSSIENITSLPYIINKLSYAIQPKGNELTRKGIIDATLENSRGLRDKKDFEVINPSLPGPLKSQFVTWCHKGVPMVGIKSTPSWLTKYKNDISEPIPNVAVVLNDFSMNMELKEVNNIYNDKSINFGSINVDVFNNVSASKLKNILKNNYELVHFIGHCDSEGLICDIDILRPDDIDFVNSKIFFLNACNSYEVGLSLIEKGSIGGVATINKILDSSALKVGVLFSRLITSGYPIDKALELSQKSFLVKNYLPMGEGSYDIFQGETNSPSEYHLDKLGNNDFEVTIRTPQINSKGGICQTYFSNVTKQCLSGNSIQFLINKKQLEKGLRNLDAPMLFQGEWYWCDQIMKMI